MKKTLLYILLVAALPLSAQKGGFDRKYAEAGFMFGLTNYSGDLAQKTIELNETHLGYGAYFRYHFTGNLSAKAHVYSGTISGDDANTTRYERHLRFSSALIEVAAVAEWNILNRDRISSTGVHNFFITPYVFGGVGMTFASTEAEYYGPPDMRNTVLKVPVPEEGLDHRFLMTPVGVGLRADIMDFMVIGVEGGWRPVFSDDLDGIRQNGNPENGDWYYFAGSTISFILGNPKKKR